MCRFLQWPTTFMVSYAYTVRPNPEYLSRVYICSVWLVDHFDTILQERAQNAKSRTAFIALYAGFLAKKIICLLSIWIQATHCAWRNSNHWEVLYYINLFSLPLSSSSYCHKKKTESVSFLQSWWQIFTFHRTKWQSDWLHKALRN